MRNRVVEPDEDNMLKITNDGKKLALDQRLINPLLPDREKIIDLFYKTKTAKIFPDRTEYEELITACPRAARADPR